MELLNLIIDRCHLVVRSSHCTQVIQFTWACYCQLRRTTSQPGLKLETEGGNLESAITWNRKSVLLLHHVMSYSVINSVQPSLKSGSGNGEHCPCHVLFTPRGHPPLPLGVYHLTFGGEGMEFKLLLIYTAESLKASKPSAFGTLKAGVMVKTL